MMLSGWINIGYTNPDSNVPTWYNTDTGATYDGNSPPSSPPPASVAVSSAKYVWAQVPTGAAIDTGNPWDGGAWYDITALPTSINPVPVPPNAPPAPGEVVTSLGWTEDTARGLYGYLFRDAAGNYYNRGVKVNLTDAQAQAEITGAAEAARQAFIANQKDNTAAILASIAAIGIVAMPSIVGYAESIGNALTATAAGTADASQALVAELAAQDAAAASLESTIADVMGSAAAEGAIDMPLLQDAAEQAASEAAKLAQEASDAATTAGDAGTQAAAQAAKTAATTLKTAADAAATATPTTAASLLAGLKTAAAAASSAAALIRVAGSLGSNTPALPYGAINPATGQPYTPYLTQRYGTSTNMLLPLAAIAALAFIARR